MLEMGYIFWGSDINHSIKLFVPFKCLWKYVFTNVDIRINIRIVLSQLKMLIEHTYIHIYKKHVRNLLT